MASMTAIVWGFWQQFIPEALRTFLPGKLTSFLPPRAKNRKSLIRDFRFFRCRSYAEIS